MRQFNQDVLASGGELETVQPARAPSFGADVGVPVAQATVTAAIVASLLVFVAARVWRIDDLGLIWVGSFLGVLSVSWLALLNSHRQLLWLTERVTGLDLDGDDQVGQPDPQERLVLVNREQARQETTRERKLGAWLSFLDFVQRIPSKGTTLRSWESEVGRANYVTWRDALIDYGMADWKVRKEDGSPVETHGWELTKSVDDIMDRLSID